MLGECLQEYALGRIDAVELVFDLDPAKVNVNGGAVAIGHPIGASGGRILMTLIYELRRRGGRYELAGICSGTAQGDAMVVEAL